MRLFHPVVGVAIICLSGCAGVPREQALQLAKSGAEASDAASRDVLELSNRVDRQAGLMAFNGTYMACALATTPADCEAEPFDPAQAAATQKLVRAITLRAEAMTALGDAYRALSLEAEYDAEGAMETVVGRLATSVNAYASLFTGPGTLIGEPLAGVITQGAGLLARDRQRARLRAGSESIRLAVTRMREILALEQNLYAGLSATLSPQENLAIENLYQAGLIERAPVLRPLAADLGVSLVPGAEAVLANDRAARTATLAYLRGQQQSRQHLQAARYLAIQNAFAKLEKAHFDFEQTGSPDIADLTRAVAEITALIPAPKESTP